jgi:peptidoglycan/xylan/chitin deacetylase (PgdA/CDA1 family)
MLVVGASRIQMNFFLKALNKGNPNVAKVAITFDDGPDRESTIEILKVLKKHQVKATFFCIGSKVEENEHILKEISANGHLIGNHTWSHAYLFDFFLPAKMRREINKTDAIIQQVTGTRLKLFRPPYGVTNPFLSKALKRTKHTVIGWSLRTFDTSIGNQRVLDKIELRLKNGDIILFHDTSPNIITLVDDAITLIKQKGIEIVNLDELLNLHLKD